MRFRSWFLCCSLLLVAPLFAGNGEVKRADKKIPDRYIVVLEDGFDVEEAASALTFEYGGKADKHYKHARKGFAVEMSEGHAKQMAKDPRVAWVEEDAEIQLEATQTGATWGLDRIDQRDLPLNTTYTYN